MRMTKTASRNAATMLLAFRACNARSFRDPIALSLEGTALSEDGVPREIPWREGETRSSEVSVLPAAGVFGANASGKTNLLRVMDDMRDFVKYSFQFSNKRKAGRERPLRGLRRPFRLDKSLEDQPSMYEIDVIIAGVRHVYGFEVDDSRVLSEWAIRFPRGKAATIFRRDRDSLYVRTTGASALKQLVKPEILVLSIAQAVDYPDLEPLYSWFDSNLIFASASSREMRWRETLQYMTDDNRRSQVLQLLRVADLGITDAHPENPEPEQLEHMQKLMSAIRGALPMDELGEDEREELLAADLDTIIGIRFSHQAAHGIVQFEGSDESLGTLVWLGLIAPVLAALANGTVLLVDEIESSLHPKLVAELVTMFQRPVSNPNNAQLIFNSHEARLLGNSAQDRIIGRDQVWFTEKLKDGSTRLYPLSDSSPRREEAIARRYMEGRYGGTPLISHAEFTALAKAIAGDGQDDDFE
jgi:uncharacterized protein